MPCIAYRDIKFRRDSLTLIDRVNLIVNEYTAQGYELTLRQVYYQLVARGFIPNNERSYKNLGNLINDGRMAGEIESAVLLVHGEKAHSCYFSRDAFAQFTGDNKELVIIPGAVHTDLYDQVDIIPFDKLAEFFSAHLI